MKPEAEGRRPARESCDARTALAASVDLACCDVDESAWIIHRWLRDHQPHDAVAITTNRTRGFLSQWTSPAFPLPSGIDLSAADAAPTLGRPIVVAAGEAAASSATIHVVLERRQALLQPGLDRALQALARLIAARVDRLPAATGTAPATDSAPLALAHAVAAERARLTQELTSHFGEHLQTILGELRGAAADDAESRVQSAAATASRALVDLRARRPLWRQARRADEAFAVVEREIGDLARSADLQVELTLAGRPDHLVGNTVLDAASWITRAAVLNAVEHAQATRGRVGWSVLDDELVVSVVDDGRGFDPDRDARGGLRAMRRCAETLGGSLEIDSNAGWGTHLRAHLSLHAKNVLQVDESASALVGTLGARELDVLRLIAVGHRNRDIADELALSQHTVKFHVGNLFEKLGVRTRAEAAAVAFAAGIHPRPAAAAPASGV